MRLELTRVQNLFIPLLVAFLLVGCEGDENKVPTLVPNDATPAALGPARGVTLSGPAELIAGECKSYLLNFLDSSGKAGLAPAGLVISFDGIGAMRLSRRDDCSDKIETVTLDHDSKEEQIYLMGTTAKKFRVLPVPQRGETILTLPFDIVVKPTTPASTNIVGKSMIKAGECESFTVSLVDRFGNATSFGETQNFESDLGEDFYQDGKCTSATPITVPAGRSSFTVFMKLDVEGSYTFTIASAPKVVVGNPITVQVLPATAGSVGVAISANPRFGDCVALTLFGMDAFGNRSNVNGDTKVTVTGTADSFQTSDTCGSANPYTFTIPDGSKQITKSIKFNRLGKVQVVVNDYKGQLASGKTDITVIANLPKTAVLVSTGKLRSGDYKKVSVSLIDQYQNPTTASEDLQLTWSLQRYAVGVPVPHKAIITSKNGTSPIATSTFLKGQDASDLYLYNPGGGDPFNVRVVIATNSRGVTGPTDLAAETFARWIEPIEDRNKSTFQNGNCYPIALVAKNMDGTAGRMPSGKVWVETYHYQTSQNGTSTWQETGTTCSETGCPGSTTTGTTSCGGSSQYRRNYQLPSGASTSLVHFFKKNKGSTLGTYMVRISIDSGENMYDYAIGYPFLALTAPLGWF